LNWKVPPLPLLVLPVAPNWKLGVELAPLPLEALPAPNWKLGVELAPLPLEALPAPKTNEPVPLPLLVLPKLKVLPPLPLPLFVLPKLKEPPPTEELLDKLEVELFKPPNPTVLLLLLLPKTGVVAFILLV